MELSNCSTSVAQNSTAHSSIPKHCCLLCIHLPSVQVLIRVLSSSVNPVDVQIRSGVILKRWDMTVKYPKVWPHHDMAHQHEHEIGA
jgi:hypothetical protein